MAAADDFRMGGFMGPMPMQVLNIPTQSLSTLFIKSPQFVDAWVVAAAR